MSQQLTEQHESWIGRTLHDASGHKVGKIEDIYTDDDTGQPEWIAVTTGLFGSNVSFVPVAGASLAGDDVMVPFPKEQVKEAPNAGADGQLSQEEEAHLYGHYGLDYDEERVRLQRWVEAESPKAAPMAHGGARDTGDPLSDDGGQRSTMGGDRMEPEWRANAGLPAEGRHNADDYAPYGDERTDAQAYGPQVDAGREAPHR